MPPSPGDSPAKPPSIHPAIIVAMRRDELSLPEPPHNDRPGDRWKCGRDGTAGACSQGPSRFGRCPRSDVCRPQRTWHGRRKQIVTLGIASLVVLLAVLAQQPWRAALFKPGDLATPHAQILAGTLTSDRCASCHPQASTSVPSWFSKQTEGHENVSQTDRCLNCHHTTIDRSTATLAHNLPETARDSIRVAALKSPQQSWHDLLPAPAIDQENIQCNACHREHRGSANNLSAVSDSQCQTCHADRFGSFASSHPDWNRWPYGRGRTIAFNHSTHANKHFPATKQGDGVAQFQCADCHHKTSDNELTRVTTYERGCKSCHESGLRTEVADGLVLFALPTLTLESAERVGQWPSDATGFYDGTIGAITELMLRSDASIDQWLREIPQGEFSQIDADNSRSVEAAERIGKEFQSLLNAISTQGQSVVAKRITASGITPSSAAKFVQSLPTQLIAGAEQDWFGKSDPLERNQAKQRHSFQPPTVAKPDDGLLLEGARGDDDLLGNDRVSGDDALLNDALIDESMPNGDPLAIDSIVNPTDSVASSGRFDADQMMPEGGWYRDDLRMAIRYRGGGHADPVLKSAIDIVSQLPATDPIHQRLLKTQGIAACIACHRRAVVTTGAWQSEPLIGGRREFTKFTHRAHLNISNLADCVHCHRIDSVDPPTSSLTQVKLSGDFNDPHDFRSMERQACVGCHTPQAAGDACIKCHRYHIDLQDNLNRYQSP